MTGTPCNAEHWSPILRADVVPVLLVRHGRTAWNHERRFLGRTDIPLDDEGRREAAAVAAHLSTLPLAEVHSSALSRASETADAIALPHGLSPALHDDLVELSQGVLEGQPGHVLPERFPEFLQAWIDDPTDARVPEGESLGECQARSVAGLQRIVARARPGAPVVVVSHQMVISSVLCHVLGEPLREWRALGHRNAAYSVLWARDGRLDVVQQHVTAHLPPQET
ncbi:MAG: histidine phosphatase family protein [Alphaproteobacteria bacterium]|nr:histidine phosphatase family protein [Alphaproteobacteria bacterium]